jgi:hypothetical protein
MIPSIPDLLGARDCPGPGRLPEGLRRSSSPRSLVGARWLCYSGLPMEALPARLDVEGLHLRLRERLAELQRPVVADVMRVFLEVASLGREHGLWSLEFAFDEDDGQVARIEARFCDPRVEDPVAGTLRGYEVTLVMPRVIPLLAPADRKKAAEHVLVMAAGHGSLVSRFVGALTDLGAYRGVEPVEVLSAEAHLL